MTPSATFTTRPTDSSDRNAALTARTPAARPTPAPQSPGFAKRFLTALMQSLAAPHS